ncbi:hypothetical protein QW060_25760 [Myroides ceti]|uniref:Helicase Lhr-like winged helix domain-containing protein n=1 Tax=Paenimyroides ceti TaxID=395087 RepID=A0ABT8D485_9FLAO|nr:hypothetical protein [Paenimyroides ceti]MDN3710260.1 hypothetical protein [Paenimyroides ceti]
MIYFLPTHSLETMEGASLRYALSEKMVEQRLPYIRSFDMLISFMIDIAVSDGFQAEALYNEVIQTHCYKVSALMNSMNVYNSSHREEVLYMRMMNFIKWLLKTDFLSYFQTYCNAASFEYRSHCFRYDASGKIKKGKYLGSVEEWFVSRLKEGDVFWFSGRALQLVHTKIMKSL